jgi:hypothetical protein
LFVIAGTETVELMCSRNFQGTSNLLETPSHTTKLT